MDGFKLSPQWKEAVRVMLENGMTYGSTITKEQIAELLELRQPRHVSEVNEFNLAFLRGVTDIRNALLQDHKMYLASNYDGSYRVLMPQDQTTHAVEHGRNQIQRELKKMAAGLAYTNIEMLTDDGRRVNADAQAKLATLASIFQEQAPRLDQ